MLNVSFLRFYLLLRFVCVTILQLLAPLIKTSVNWFVTLLIFETLTFTVSVSLSSSLITSSKSTLLFNCEI